MEFVSLVGPGGALWNAWVAAHWERRLKRHDYAGTDVSATASFVLARLSRIPLRCVGHLLVGACRILLRQTSYLQDDADEVRIALLTSAKAGPELPKVRTLKESDVTLRRVAAVEEAPWWDMDLVGDEPMELLLEPEEVEATVEEGRRHVAPLESITLSAGPKFSPELAPLEGLEVFGAASPEEVAAMEALRQAAMSPSLSPAYEPFDEGLGFAEDMDLEALGTVEGEGRREEETPLDFLGMSAAPTTPGAASAVPEPEQAATPTPRRLVRTLEFETPTEGQPPPTEEELAESSYLARLLDTPPRPDHPRAQTLRSARAAPAAEGARAAAEGAAEQPAKKRRRKPKPWLDEKTEIPRDEYHDTTAITRYPLYEYDLTLPHRHPNIGLTTTFGDLCPMLCELFLRAPVVGEKRRRACADSMEAAAAPAAATPGAPEQPASRAGSTSRRVAVTPGSSPGAPSPGAPSSLGAPSPGALPSPAAPAAPSVPVSPGMAYPSPEMPGAPPSPPGPPSPFEPMQVDVDMGPGLETPTGAEMDVVMGAESTGRQLVLREDTPPPVQRQAVRDAGVDIEAVGAIQKHQLKGVLGPSGAEESKVSFIRMCEGPPGGADSAARRFMNLLLLHMEGSVSLKQDEAYGDIAIGRGPMWAATMGA